MLRRLSGLNPVRGVRRLRRLIAAIESVPELQTKVEQCMLVYQKDARFADRIRAFQAKADARQVIAYTRAAVARAELEHDPCPHAVIDELVPGDLYDEMISALPSSVFFKQQELREEMQVPFVFAPAYSRLVWDFFFHQALETALVPALTEKFRPALDAVIARYWPALGTWDASGLTLSVSNSRLLLRRPGYLIKPHRDPRWHFITCLVYLQKRDADSLYGTQLYRLRGEREPSHSSPFRFELDDCELVKETPARRNTALAFLNSSGAHGASIPADAPADLQRYVYQVQLGPNEATKKKLIDQLSAADRPGWVTKYREY